MKDGLTTSTREERQFHTDTQRALYDNRVLDRESSNYGMTPAEALARLDAVNDGRGEPKEGA